MKTRSVALFAFLVFLMRLGAALPQPAQTPGQQAPAAAAPASGSGSPGTPVFKSRAEVVLVPVVVQNKHGGHVAGLTKDAFHLEENGKEQGITYFEEVKVEKSPQSIPQPTDGSYSNLPSDAAQNLRVTIIVLDLLNTGVLQRTDAKDQMIKFLSKNLHNDEPISLLCITANGVRLVRPFTFDRDLLVRSLRELKIEGVRLGSRRDAVHNTLEQLRQIAQAYNGVPGRKTLIWATGNIPYPQVEVDDNLSPYAGADVVVMGEFEDTWRTLISANTAVYPVGLLAAADDPALRSFTSGPYQQTLHAFADETGGNLCVESNNFEQCLNEAVDDSRSYYLLSYPLKPDDRKPGWRNLKVKVDGEHGQVRARSRFYYAGDVDPTKPATGHQDEINALASPLAASGVRMNVRVLPPAAPTSTGPNPGGKTTTHFLITIPLGSVTLDSSRPNSLDLEVGAIALDKHIKDAGEFLHPVKGNPKPETVSQFARDGIRLQEKLDLLPGTYDMRFMVRDNATGEIGTVVFPLDVK